MDFVCNFRLMMCVFVCLAQETVYGKRDGYISGLAIVSKDSKNVFRGTRGFKTGTILNVEMLQRQDMYKPQARHRHPTLHGYFCWNSSIHFPVSPSRNHHTKKTWYMTYSIESKFNISYNRLLL